MDWFHKTMITGASALALLVSGYAGYSIHERFNPQQIISLPDSRAEDLQKRCDDYEGKFKEKDTAYSQLMIDKIKADTSTAWAEQREARAKRELEMKPYELEKKNAELEGRVSTLEAQRSAHTSQDEATKAKYEAEIAKKERDISVLEAQMAVLNSKEALLRAQYETAIARERTEKAKLERRLIENGNGYTLPARD